MRTKPRALSQLLQLQVAERLPVIKEGLDLLIEHVETLRVDAEHLIAAGRKRSAPVVNNLGEEEAAKVLILLDLVRLGWKDQTAASQQINKFSKHLARGIYAEVPHIRPATYGEVREYVNSLRLSHYLDGPNDVDWIYRNEFEAQREESLYVDYVLEDEGARWVTPRDREILASWGASPVIDLALALARIGLTELEGLRLLHQEWRGIDLDDGDKWADVVVPHNRSLLSQLEAAGLMKAAT